MAGVLENYMSIEQQILLFIYESEGKPVTIEELQEQLHMPRSTVVDHLNALERDGFLEMRKEGRKKQYFQVAEISVHVKEALNKLNDAYVYALGFIQQRRLRQLKSLQKKGGDYGKIKNRSQTT